MRWVYRCLSCDRIFVGKFHGKTGNLGEVPSERVVNLPSMEVPCTCVKSRDEPTMVLFAEIVGFVPEAGDRAAFVRYEATDSATGKEVLELPQGHLKEEFLERAESSHEPMKKTASSVRKDDLAIDNNCPTCNFPVGDKDAYCGNCGRPIRCEVCGTLAKFNKFCTGCGNNLVRANSQKKS